MLNIAGAVSKIGFALLNTAVISTQIQILIPRCLPWNTISWQMPLTSSATATSTQLKLVKYLPHTLQSECFQRCENMCVKLLKMFLAAHPVSERSHFSCQCEEQSKAGQGQSRPVVASLTGTNIFK